MDLAQATACSVVCTTSFYGYGGRLFWQGQPGLVACPNGDDLWIGSAPEQLVAGALSLRPCRVGLALDDVPAETGDGACHRAGVMAAGATRYQLCSRHGRTWVPPSPANGAGLQRCTILHQRTSLAIFGHDHTPRLTSIAAVCSTRYVPQPGACPHFFPHVPRILTPFSVIWRITR